jgi:hypothetical protein
MSFRAFFNANMMAIFFFVGLSVESSVFAQAVEQNGTLIYSEEGSCPSGNKLFQNVCMSASPNRNKVGTCKCPDKYLPASISPVKANIGCQWYRGPALGAVPSQFGQCKDRGVQGILRTTCGCKKVP